MSDYPWTDNELLREIAEKLVSINEKLELIRVSCVIIAICSVVVVFHFLK